MFQCGECSDSSLLSDLEELLGKDSTFPDECETLVPVPRAQTPPNFPSVVELHPPVQAHDSYSMETTMSIMKLSTNELADLW